MHNQTNCAGTLRIHRRIRHLVDRALAVIGIGASVRVRISSISRSSFVRLSAGSLIIVLSVPEVVIGRSDARFYNKTMVQFVRITFIDQNSTVSFGAEGHVLKMLAHACSRNPVDFNEVLAILDKLDPETAYTTRRGISQFDEFVVRDDPDSVTAWLADNDPADGRPIRLVDPRLREATLSPLELGIVLFNLPDRRVVQIENRYGSLLRKDRGRMRRDGRPVAQIYRYELSDDWSLLP